MYHKWKSAILYIWMISFSLLLISGCRTGYHVFLQKVSEEEPKGGKKAKAEQIAANLLASWREGQFALLGDESTNEMRSFLTPKVQRDTYGTIKEIFGDYQSMEYVETWKEGSKFVINRFRGRFSKSKEMPEIRVVMDDRGKLDGFWGPSAKTVLKLSG